MLNHPTLEKLRTLRLIGMLQALQEQTQMSEIEALSFEERLGLLVDREVTERENRRLHTRLGVFCPSPRNGIFQGQKSQHGHSEPVFEPYCRSNIYGISFTRFSGSIAEEPSFLLYIFFSKPPCLTPSRAFFGREGYIQLAIMAIIGGAPPTRPTPELHLFGGMGKKPLILRNMTN